MTPCYSLDPLSFVEILSGGTLTQYVQFVAHDSPSRELRYIPPGYPSYWSNFPLCILSSGSFGDHHPVGLLHLTEQFVHCSAPVNALARLRLFANTTPVAPFKA
ncbi:hypothetical protein GW17_00047258 [Ensete ventricosum]|nr:hypothetical protein GW17_00047258 [Ensete ventricosum]